MNLLQAKIKEASQKYYSDGSSDVTDAEFDAMLDKLKQIDPNSPLLKTGHGYELANDSTEGEHITHKYGPAGSLDKCRTWQEIPQSFLNSSKYHASLKIDGLSIVLYYNSGVLARAVTRGEGGLAGIDVTNKLSKILGSNCILRDTTFTGAVRGEVVMSYDNFHDYQVKHPEAKNPRNSAAGLLNSKQYSDAELKLLDVVTYTIVGIEPFMNVKNDYTYTECWDWLAANFKHVAPHDTCEISASTIDTLMEDLRAAWYGRYPADGIVLAKDELVVMPLSNQPNCYSINYQAMAYKYKAESAETKVTDVEWNLTKTKYLVPKVKVETVNLSGTSVTYATGFNAQNILNQKLNKGAVIRITKSNEIIPYIEEVLSGVEAELPECCPACGSKLSWTGVHLQCSNNACTGGDIQDVLIWMKHIAPWDGLGDTLKVTFLEKLFGENVTIEKIYERGPLFEDEFVSDSVTQNQFKQMYNALFTNQVKMSDALKALNILRIGDVTSRKIAEHPEVIHDTVVGKYCEQYNQLIGEANYQSIWVNRKKLARLGFIRRNIVEEVRTDTKGKVAITGKLSVKRSLFEEELRAAGYEPANISKDTKYLITDSPDASTDKNKKADAWGITKVTEAQFRSKYM